eukprot:3502190-Prymnesium_polylepis.1
MEGRRRDFTWPWAQFVRPKRPVDLERLHTAPPQVLQYFSAHTPSVLQVLRNTRTRSAQGSLVN